MTADSTNALFFRELRLALQHLYDPAELRRSPLLRVFGVDGEEDPPAALRQLLLKAIEALKPGPNVPPQANAWRLYHVLSNRYVEQFTQREVATDLGLSIRQLRRQENEAIGVLADYLAGRHGRQLRHISSMVAGGGDEPSPEDGEAPSREQELEWLKRSFPSEPVGVAEVVQEALRTVAPLAQAMGVRTGCALPEGLPHLAVQRTSMRQALLNILTAAVRSAPGGRVEVQAELCAQKVCIHIQPAKGRPAPALQGDDVESLKMAGELAALSGGSLEVRPGENGKSPFNARLVFPAVGQVEVLAIDDNVDTLQLFERYLSGSRYRLITLRDPQKALTLAEELAPQAIVLDVMLPGIDGWELLGRLREHPRTRGVPVIVCAILPQEQLALTLGAAAFLRKPVGRRALLEALDRIVQGSVRPI